MCKECKWREICKSQRGSCKYFAKDVELEYETKLLDSIEYIDIINAIENMKKILSIKDIRQLANDLITEKRVLLHNQFEERGEFTEKEKELLQFLVNNSTIGEEILMDDIKNRYENPMRFGATISTLVKKKAIEVKMKKFNKRKKKVICITEKGFECIDCL